MQNRNADLYHVIKIQALLSVVLSGLLLIFISSSAAFSALVGAGISTCTGALMVQILKLKPGDSADKFFGKLMMAESVKFITVILLLAVALIWLPVEPSFLLIGFSVALLAYWIALARTLTRN